MKVKLKLCCLYLMLQFFYGNSWSHGGNPLDGQNGVVNTKVHVKKESMSCSGVPSIIPIQAIFVISLVERSS